MPNLNAKTTVVLVYFLEVEYWVKTEHMKPEYWYYHKVSKIQNHVRWAVGRAGKGPLDHLERPPPLPLLEQQMLSENSE